MSELILYNAETLMALELPFADEGVRAGFPSPAQSYMENAIDLNRDLVHHPESTFYARVVGDSIGLSGLWVMLAVVLGGGFFGIPGIFIGIPLMSAIYELVRTDIDRRKSAPTRSPQEGNIYLDFQRTFY